MAQQRQLELSHKFQKLLALEELQGRCKWQSEKLTLLQERWNQMNQDERYNEEQLASFLELLEREKVALGALHISISLFQDASRTHTEEEGRRRSTTSAQMNPRENASRSRSYTTTGNTNLTEHEIFRIQEKALKQLELAWSDVGSPALRVKQRETGTQIETELKVPQNSEISQHSCLSTSEPLDISSTDNTTFEDKTEISDSEFDLDDSTIKHPVDVANSQSQWIPIRKDSTVVEALDLETKIPSLRQKMTRSISQNSLKLIAKAFPKVDAGRHRETATTKKPLQNAEEVLKSRLESTEAKEELKHALEDIKRKILECERRVSQLSSQLQKTPSTSVHWKEIKMDLEEEKMLLAALQINVMVFKRFTETAEKGVKIVAPELVVTDTTAKSSSKPFNKHRRSSSTGLGGINTQKHLQPIQPTVSRRGTKLEGIRRSMNPNADSAENRAARPRTRAVSKLYKPFVGAQNQTELLEGLPSSFRYPPCYHSECKDLSDITCYMSEHFECELNNGSYSLKKGTLSDCLAWILFHNEKLLMMNLDERTFLLCYPEVYSSDDVALEIEKIFENFENTSYPKEFGATGMQKRLYNFIDQAFKFVHNKMSIDSRLRLYNLVDKLMGEEKSSALSDHTMIEQEVLRHLPGAPIDVDDPFGFFHIPDSTIPLNRSNSVAADALSPPAFNILSHSVEKIGHELSAIMADYMFCLGQRLGEFRDLAWTKSPQDAPIISSLTDFWNRISRFVVYSILTAETPKHQVTIMKYWLKIARVCLDVYGDFNSTSSIMAGLNDIAVTRLKKYKDLLSWKYIEAYQELDRTLGSEDNFKLYRTLFAETSYSIPFLPIHLRDIVYIMEGLPKSSITDADGRKITNFERMTKLSDYVFGLGLHLMPLKPNLPLTADKSIGTILTQLSPPTADILFQYSQRIEPPDIKVLQNQLESQNVRINILQDQIDKYRAQLSQLKQEDCTIPSFPLGNETLFNQIAELKAQVEEYRHQLAETRTKLRKEQEEKEACNTIIQTLQTELEALKAETGTHHKSSESKLKTAGSWISPSQLTTQSHPQSPTSSRKNSNKQLGAAREDQFSSRSNSTESLNTLCVVKMTFGSNTKAIRFSTSLSVRDMKIVVIEKFQETYPIETLRQCKMFTADQEGNPQAEIYSNMTVYEAFNTSQFTIHQNPPIYFACLQPPFFVSIK